MDAQALLYEFQKRNLTLGSAESFTGGLFASAITDIPGASRVFKGALVTYATSEKTRLLNLSPDLIKAEGVVSAAVADQMALQALGVLAVDIAVSFTGNAGPDTLDHLPVGTAYVGIAGPRGHWTFPLALTGTRQEIREKAVAWAIAHLEGMLKEGRLG